MLLPTSHTRLPLKSTGTTIRNVFSFCLNVGFFLSVLDLTSADSSCKADPTSTCRCQTANGDWIDLSALVTVANTDPLFHNESANNPLDKARYSYRPCSPMHITGTETCDLSAVCQSSGSNYFNAGSYTSAMFYGDPGESDFSLQYTGDTDGTLRKSIVYLVCSSSEKDFKVKGETDPGTKIYEMTLSTKYACVRSTSGPGNKLSVGSILLIVFFVLLVVYLVGGLLLLRFVRGARGVEQIPNYTFWLDFPGLVKDGTMFVFRGCKADSDRTYDQI